MAVAQPNRTSGKRQSAAEPREERSFDRLRTNGESVSRRVVLGAAVGLPLPCHPGLDPGSIWSWAAEAEEWIPDQVRDDEGGHVRDDRKWQRALAAFEAAAGEVRAFEAACSGRGFEEQEALQGEYDALGEAMDSALRRLLLAPAPDVAALARKIGLAFAHEIEPHSGGEPWAAAILADARRLSTAGMGTVR